MHAARALFARNEIKSKKNSTEISYQKVKIQGAQIFPSLRMEHVRLLTIAVARSTTRWKSKNIIRRISLRFQNKKSFSSEFFASDFRLWSAEIVPRSLTRSRAELSAEGDQSWKSLSAVNSRQRQRDDDTVDGNISKVSGISHNTFSIFAVHNEWKFSSNQRCFDFYDC